MHEVVRELGERWRASGSADDLVAYLYARLWSGDLSRERLEFAAHCGSREAQRVLERPAQASLGGAEWVRGFASFEPRLTARFVQALWPHVLEPHALLEFEEPDPWSAEPAPPLPPSFRDAQAEAFARYAQGEGILGEIAAAYANQPPSPPRRDPKRLHSEAVFRFVQASCTLRQAATPAEAVEHLGHALRWAETALTVRAEPFERALAAARRNAVEQALHGPVDAPG